MFERKQLANSILWPLSVKTVVHLLDEQGSVFGEFKLKEPIRGDLLARLVPAGFFIDFDDAQLISELGDIVTTTKLPFDTVVVTERAQVPLEDRLQRLERREARRQRRQERDHAELVSLREQAAKFQGPFEKPPEVIEPAVSETKLVPDGETAPPLVVDEEVTGDA